MGADNETTEGGNGRFTNVELFLDEQRHHREDHGEGSDDGVRQMGVIDTQLVPTHGYVLCR